jgi:hypothetical protein
MEALKARVNRRVVKVLDEGNRAKHAEAIAAAQQVVQVVANVYLPGSQNSFTLAHPVV